MEAIGNEGIVPGERSSGKTQRFANRLDKDAHTVDQRVSAAKQIKKLASTMTSRNGFS
jgi:hypothetical protein